MTPIKNLYKFFTELQHQIIIDGESWLKIDVLPKIMGVLAPTEKLEAQELTLSSGEGALESLLKVGSFQVETVFISSQKSLGYLNLIIDSYENLSISQCQGIQSYLQTL